MGSGECAAGTKEACDTGCGVKTCLNSCSYGGCAPTYDPYEYNNVKSLAHSFQSEPLAEGTTLTTTEQAWIHSATDVDWYKVDVVESGGLDWSLVLEASLAGGESGLREICLIYDRKSDGTTDFQKCTAGSENVLNVSLGNIDNVGANDDGTLYIKVTGKEGCAGYDLLVSVD